MQRCRPIRNKKWTLRGRWLWAPAGAAILAILNACGSGAQMTSAAGGTASAASCSASTCGSAVMTMTDAAGDFLTYQVDLVSLQLKKADGTLVETLPATTTVDLVQLVNLTEILSSRQIPPGEYVSAQVTVDYSHAVVMVDDGTGNAVAVKPVDSTGAALGQVQMTVQLDAKNDLKINAARASRIAFDFNLLASNMVNVTAKTVTVTPILVASVVAPDAKQVRVRGGLASVDSANSDYTVQVDPFNDHDDGKQSPLVVHTTGTTSFEINGIPFAGAAGLTQLAALPANSVTVAFGTLQAADQTFVATSVLAGISVETPDADHVSGNVIARSGDTVTVHGARLDDQGGGHHFIGGNVSVTIAATTAVTADGQSSSTPAHTIAEVSVGSLIDAFGTSHKDASGNVSMDATSGRVRLELTRVEGVVSAAGSGQLTMNLSSIDRQPASLFNFAGTGAAAGSDSNPLKYQVGTGGLDLSPFSAGSTVLGMGFVSPFASAPPDFNAVTLANGPVGDDDGGNGSGANAAELDIDWGDSGTAAPFKALDAMHLDLDAANPNIGDHHQIDVDSREIDIEKLAADPSIVPSTSAMTLFAITGRHGGATVNFQSFADFEAALAGDLTGTTTALRMTAEGQYDTAANVFTARRITILLSN